MPTYTLGCNFRRIQNSLSKLGIYSERGVQIPLESVLISRRYANMYLRIGWIYRVTRKIVTFKKHRRTGWKRSIHCEREFQVLLESVLISRSCNFQKIQASRI